MKLLFALLIVFALCVSASSQIPETWRKIYKPGASEQNPTDMTIDNQGNVIVTGDVDTNTHPLGNIQIGIVKYSSSGVQLWNVDYGNNYPALERSNAVITDSQGNIYVTGRRYTTVTEYQALTVKYNSSGVFQWERVIDSAGVNDQGVDIKVGSDGNIYNLIYSGGAKVIKFNSSGSEIWRQPPDPGSFIRMEIDGQDNIYTAQFTQAGLKLIKINSAGIQQWVTVYTGPYPSIKSFIRDNANNLYIAGQGTMDIVKFNSDGVFQWADSVADWYNDVAIDPAGNIFAAGKIGNNTIIKKYSPSGTILWAKYFDDLNYSVEEARYISTDNLGNCYVLAYFSSASQTFNVYTKKLNPSGSQMWIKTYGGASADNDIPRNLIVKNVDEVYVLVASNNTGFAPDFVTIKYGGSVSIIQTGNSIPSEFMLYQNYPNPFNPETNIRFDLPEASNVKITIYNSLGKEMQVLADEHKQAGSYEVKFNAAGYAGGAYFYRVEAGEFTKTKKMLLLK